MKVFNYASELLIKTLLVISIFSISILFIVSVLGIVITSEKRKNV